MINETRVCDLCLSPILDLEPAVTLSTDRLDYTFDLCLDCAIFARDRRKLVAASAYKLDTNSAYGKVVVAE